MKRRVQLSVRVAVALVAGRMAWAQFDNLDVALTPPALEHCHVLQFLQGWSFSGVDERTHQRLFFGLEYSDYEFRVDGVLSTKFLVAAFTEFVGRNNYTVNRYRVDLADSAAPVTPASREAWDAATVVQITRKSAFASVRPRPDDQVLKFNGFEFVKSGQIWDRSFRGAARLSPDQSWLVLQSREMNSGKGMLKVFFDFFNADAGLKVFSLEGHFSSLHNGADPDTVLAKTGWVTERYFIIPIGRNRERCLVCDFGKRAAEK